MSDPIKVGGSYTCNQCREWCDGSEIHVCPAPPVVEEATCVKCGRERGDEYSQLAPCDVDRYCVFPTATPADKCKHGVETSAVCELCDYDAADEQGGDEVQNNSVDAAQNLSVPSSELRPTPTLDAGCIGGVQIDFTCGCGSPFFKGSRHLVRCDVHLDGRPMRLQSFPPQWQPIETASKHGVPIRVYHADYVNEDFNPTGTFEAYWQDGEGFICAVWNAEFDGWDAKTGHPTHWMPLPTPPSSTQREGGSVAQNVESPSPASPHESSTAEHEHCWHTRLDAPSFCCGCEDLQDAAHPLPAPESQGVGIAGQCRVTCQDFSMCDCDEPHQCVLDNGHPFDPLYGEIHRFVTHMMPIEPRDTAAALNELVKQRNEALDQCMELHKRLAQYEEQEIKK